jgi:hypothetical protein
MPPRPVTGIALLFHKKVVAEVEADFVEEICTPGIFMPEMNLIFIFFF